MIYELGRIDDVLNMRGLGKSTLLKSLFRDESWLKLIIETLHKKYLCIEIKSGVVSDLGFLLQISN